MNVAEATIALEQRMGDRYGGGFTPESLRQAVADAQQAILYMLPENEIPAQMKKSAALAMASTVVVVTLPTDIAKITSVERTEDDTTAYMPCQMMDPHEFAQWKSARNSFQTPSADHPVASIQQETISVLPAGEAGGDTEVMVNYLEAIGDVIGTSVLVLPEHRTGLMLEYAEGLISRSRGPEHQQAGQAMMNNAMGKLGVQLGMNIGGGE